MRSTRHPSNDTSLKPILPPKGYIWAGTLMQTLAHMHLNQLLTRLLTNMRLIVVNSGMLYPMITEC